MNKDARLIFEAYQEKLQEGLFGRTAANLSGLGAKISQPFKNLQAGMKAGTQVAGGDVAGAQQSMGSIKTPGQAQFDAKVKSITAQYVKNIANDLVKLNLVGAEKTQQIEDAVNKTIMDLVTPAKPAAPAAPTAPAPVASTAAAPAPAKKLVSRAVKTKASADKAKEKISDTASKVKFKKIYK